MFFRVHLLIACVQTPHWGRFHHERDLAVEFLHQPSPGWRCYCWLDTLLQVATGSS